MIQIRKEENQKKQKEKKLKVYKVNTHKKTVIALWVKNRDCPVGAAGNELPVCRL